jgi:hypothetical protein
MHQFNGILKHSLFFRHILHARHLHQSTRGGGLGGRSWHRGEDSLSARLQHTDAGPVRVLPPGAARARHQQKSHQRRRHE